MSEGDNKRVVKKTNTKKMSIKVSTEDKDAPLSTQTKNEKNDNAKNRKSVIPEETPKMSLTQLLENNQNLENQLLNMKDELKNEEEKTMNDVNSLNQQLEELNKIKNNVCYQNKSLMNRLKKMEQEISKQFEDKFKISKIIEKQKYSIYNRDINTEIKSHENEKKNVEKAIKYNQKEIDKLNHILENNDEKAGKQLEDQYNELKNNLEEIQKELNELNQIKFEHNSCTKNETILKSRLNVLKNDVEFESKRKIMFTSVPQKKEMTTINENNKKNKFGARIRKYVLNNSKNKYVAKDNQFINHRSYNFIKKEVNENEKERLNNSLNKTDKKDLNKKKGKINYNNSDDQKIYLFTEAEKEIFKKIVPNDLFNNLNEKYNEKENEMKKIEETCKEPKDIKSKLYLDNLKYEEINMKQQELRMRKANLMSEHIKNNKKISEIKDKIKLKQIELNKENKKINRIAEKNFTLNEIIKKYIEDKKKEKEKENDKEKESEMKN